MSFNLLNKLVHLFLHSMIFLYWMRPVSQVQYLTKSIFSIVVGDYGLGLQSLINLKVNGAISEPRFGLMMVHMFLWLWFPEWRWCLSLWMSYSVLS